MRSIGLMSGTSMDGIDAALIDTDGKFAIELLETFSLIYDPEFKVLLKAAEYAVHKHHGNLNAAQHNYPEALKDYIRLLNGGSHSFKSSFTDVITQSTRLHAEVVIQLLKKVKCSAAEISVIGYHGQTLFHQPQKKITIQMGEGALLADLTHIVVVDDFRSCDIAAGGQGAPFAPIYHQALAVRDKKYPIAFVNCGGIANVTVITGKTENDVFGFDTGPGNTLIDRYVTQQTQARETMDRDGQYGKKGKIQETVLSLLHARNADYFSRRPPKSLDVADFNLIPELYSLSFEDVCATLEAFTADSIIKSIEHCGIKLPQLWVLAGGGWKNPVIYREFKNRLFKKLSGEVTICFADEMGWQSQTLEAQLFAYLAVRHLKKLPTSFPKVTGVSKALVGGTVHYPSDV